MYDVFPLIPELIQSTVRLGVFLWFFWEFRGILKGGLERFRDAGHRTL